MTTVSQRAKDVDAELDRLISRRAEQEHAESCRELQLHELRQRREREREQNRVLWIDYHRALARTHHDLAAEHAMLAEVLSGGEAMSS